MIPYSALVAADHYSVTTPVYEGPLDLLLQLIERAELDITSLALAEVTDQYLGHIRSLVNKDADEVSGFLVVAARLLQIKSEALLPRPPIREPGEEDPGQALAQQLILYKLFKDSAYFLREREKLGCHTYLRLAHPPKIEMKVDLGDMGVADLVAAARNIFREDRTRTPLGDVVTPPKITIREKISLIATRLRELGRTSFQALFNGKPTRMGVVVTFLAMLELVKRHLIRANQEGLFADIALEPDEAWDENLDFDIEFGE